MDRYNGTMLNKTFIILTDNLWLGIGDAGTLDRSYDKFKSKVSVEVSKYVFCNDHPFF